MQRSIDLIVVKNEIEIIKNEIHTLISCSMRSGLLLKGLYIKLKNTEKRYARLA